MTDYRKLPEILADHFAGERTWTWSATITEDDFAPDWRTRALRAEGALRHAKKVIQSYELDIRMLPEYLADNPTGQGFCQGDVYTEAMSDIDYWGQHAVNESAKAT